MEKGIDNLIQAMASDRHLRTVFEALDEGNLGYITADRFADLAKDFGVHDQDVSTSI